MDIQGPDAWAEALEGIIAVNRRDIRRGIIPPLPYGTGVKYVRESGTEDWLTGKQVLERGAGDCEDLAAWVTAGRREAQEANAKPMMGRTGPKTWHAMVRRENGTVEDPTKIIKGEAPMVGQNNFESAAFDTAPEPERETVNLLARVRKIPHGYAAQVKVPLHARRLISEVEEETDERGYLAATGTGPRKEDALFDSAVKTRLRALPRLREQAVYQARVVGQMALSPDGLWELSEIIDEADEELGFLPALLAAIPSAVQALPGVLQQLTPLVSTAIPQLLASVPQTIKSLFGALPGFAQLMPGAAPAAAAPGIPGLPPGLLSMLMPGAAPAAAAPGIPGLPAGLLSMLMPGAAPAAAPAAVSPFAGLLKMIPGLSGYPEDYPVEEALGEFNLPPQLLLSLLGPLFGLPVPPPVPGLMPGFPGFPIPGLPQMAPGFPFMPPSAQMTMSALEQMMAVARKPKGKKFLKKAKEKAKGLFKKLKLWGFVDLVD